MKSLAIRDTAFHLVDGAGGADLVDFALAELGFTRSAPGRRQGRARRHPHLASRASRAARGAGHEGRRARQGRGAAPAAAGAGAPPELRIDDLEIERAEFSVLTDGEPVSVALRLKTTGVSLAPDAPFPLDFGLEAGEGSLTLKGQLGLNPLVWDGKVGWQGIGCRCSCARRCPT